MAQKIELFPGDSSNWQVSSPPELRRRASMLLHPRAKKDRRIINIAIDKERLLTFSGIKDSFFYRIRIF